MHVPKAVVWLLAATLASTALGAMLHRNHVLPVLQYVTLSPHFILRGELWRLLPWVLFEYGWDGLNLVFGCAFLFMLGRDLVPLWGTRRFILRYFAVAAVTGILTTLVALVWPEVEQLDYMTMWPVLDALVIAWAVHNPGAQLMIWFVLPVSGRNIIYVTIGITVLFAFINGFAYFVPHFSAEFLALVYLDVFSFRRIYLRGRMAMLQRDYKKKTAHLRAVDRDRDEPPRWTH
jgi:hypothetical protein